MTKPLGSAVVSLLAAWASLAPAGELVLRNGDRLGGELVRIQGEVLVWNSSVFGELQVDTWQVDSLSSNIPFKIDGHEEACIWTAVAQGRARFACDDGDSGEVPLMSLKMVIPHEQYAGGHYTYRGKLALSGRRASGNKEEELWAVDSETVFRRGDYRHETRLDYDSIARDGQPAESSGRLNYSLDWFFEEQWFWYNHLHFGFDQPANIEESYTYGSGFGYQVWENTVSALSVETGLDWRKERYYAPDAPSADFTAGTDTAAWRWAVDFRYVFPRNLVLFHRHQLVRSFELPQDWLLETQTGFSLPVTGHLFTEVQAHYNVDNLPAAGGVREDKQLTLGVGYSW